jgi:hypothetical protein
MRKTPYEILYGVVPPIHIPYTPKDLPVEAMDQYLTQREGMFKLIRSNLLQSPNIMAQQANRKKSEIMFSVGELVYVKLQPYQ